MTSKYLTVILAGSLVSCAVSGLIGYRVGSQRSAAIRISSFIGSFDSLEKLKSGDIGGATHRLELLCFASAVGVFSGGGWRFESVARMMRADLVAYRQAYRTNRSEWTSTETKLESLLKP